MMLSVTPTKTQPMITHTSPTAPRPIITFVLFVTAKAILDLDLNT